jgi:hypothetical protein
MRRAMRRIIVLCAVMGTAFPAHAERLWLVVGASDGTPAGIAQKVKATGSGEGLIIRTADCGDPEHFFAWAAKIAPTEQAAKEALQGVLRTAGSAVVRNCEVKPGSLLAFRVSAVDPSIADVPATAVNWSDADRVSTVHPLPDGTAIILTRYYEPDKEDPLEGRRERVSLADRQGKIRQLEDNCIEASGFKTRLGKVIFQCAREQAGDDLLHSVLVFDKDGVKRKEVSHCRNPNFSGPRLWCQAESVKPDGSLQLRPTKHDLGK